LFAFAQTTGRRPPLARKHAHARTPEAFFGVPEQPSGAVCDALSSREQR